jgi:hypothetical protein
MQRLELVYGAGWTAVGAATLAIPLLGTTAVVLSVLLLAAALLVGYVTTAAEPDSPCATGGPPDARHAWPSLDPAERARLVCIINLSKVAASPPCARLLLSELDEALAAEPLASWPPLRELRGILRAGCRVTPLGRTETSALLSAPAERGIRHGSHGGP